ncbi:MAG: hypothetical protein ABSH35_09065 [Isosphaeraceae bacterium]
MVHLSAGDIVPADVRLVLSRDLLVNQAMLTGKSMPVEKSELLVQNVGANGRRPELDHTDPLEVSNLCFMGTDVISGTATAVVLATGGRTYYGSRPAFEEIRGESDGPEKPAHPVSAIERPAGPDDGGQRRLGRLCPDAAG